VITCHLRYVIDPDKLEQFERYARVWIGLVDRLGGVHHGYLLPSEGASNIAHASFSFPSLAAYEVYRTASAEDEDCTAAFDFARRTKCIISYERTFFRPVTTMLPSAALSA